MKSTKFRLWTTILMAVFAVVIVSGSIWIAVAALNATVVSGFNVTYTCHNVECKVSGNYRSSKSQSGSLGPDLVFNGNEAEDGVANKKSFEKLENIELERGETFEIFYVIENTGAQAFGVTAKIEDLTKENFKVEYDYLYWDGTSPQPSLAYNMGRTKIPQLYVTEKGTNRSHAIVGIRLSVIDVKVNGSIGGNMNFDMTTQAEEPVIEMENEGSYLNGWIKLEMRFDGRSMPNSDVDSITIDYFSNNNNEYIVDGKNVIANAQPIMIEDELFMYKMPKQLDGIFRFDVYILSYYHIKANPDQANAFSNFQELTKFCFNNYDTSAVTAFGPNSTIPEGMFEQCRKLTELDLSMFDTSSVKYTKDMFSGCTSLHTIYVSEKWNIDQVSASNSTYMFSSCTALQGGKGTSYDSAHTNKDYARIDDPDNNLKGYLTDIKDKPV